MRLYTASRIQRVTWRKAGTADESANEQTRKD